MLPTARHRGLHNGKASDDPYMVDEGNAVVSMEPRDVLEAGSSWRLVLTGSKKINKNKNMKALQGKRCGIHRAEGSQGRLQGQGAESGGGYQKQGQSKSGCTRAAG
jgi:hypothetical protein